MRGIIEDFDRLSLQQKLPILKELLSTYASQHLKEALKYPKVAIVIATHNRVSYLLTFLYSVFLQQGVKVKCYISDDASNDETKLIFRDLANRFPHILFYNYSVTNIGPSANRKIALKEVNEDIVVIADDDDYYVNDHFLLKASHSLQQTKEITPVFFGSAIILNVITSKEIVVTIDYVGRPLKEVALNMLFSMRKPPSTFLLVFKMPATVKESLLNMQMLNDVSIYFLLLFHFFQARLAGETQICGVYREHNTNITKRLNWDFIVENIDQQVQLIQSSPLTIEEKNKLIQKHVNNSICYFTDNSIMTKEQRSQILSVIRRQQYKGAFKDWLKWSFRLYFLQ